MSLPPKQAAEKHYKKSLRKALKLLGNGITYSDQLAEVCSTLFGHQFIGVFASDLVPRKMKRGSMAIVNLDDSTKPGSHWVALAKYNSSNTMLVYDSFGRKTKRILNGLLGGRSEQILDTEYDAEQSVDEMNCGARCVAFLMVFKDLGPRFAKYI